MSIVHNVMYVKMDMYYFPLPKTIACVMNVLTLALPVLKIKILVILAWPVLSEMNKHANVYLGIKKIQKLDSASKFKKTKTVLILVILVMVILVTHA